MQRVIVAAGALLLGASASGAAWRVEPAPDGVRFVEAGTEPARELAKLQLGAVRDVAVRELVVYVALSSGGVAVVNATDPAKPVVERKIAEGRVITRLFIAEGALLAVETRSELLSFSLANPAQPVPSDLPSGVALAGVAVAEPAVEKGVPPSLVEKVPRARPAAARVIQVVKGRAIFDKGSADGFATGTRVRVLSQRLTEKPDLASGGIKAVPSGEVVAVVAIEQADEQRSMARLGRGDDAELGDLAELTTEPLSERLGLPKRAPFSTRLGFHARPFLGLSGISKPVGLLADLYGSYYLESVPLRFEVALAPAGIAFGGAETHYPQTIVATGAYTTDYFEIGLGAGALVGKDGPCYQDRPGAPSLCERNTGFTINQVLRLGAIDGFNVLWQSSVFSRPDSFVFGVGRGEVNVPVSSRLGLFAAGGGGENGWNFGEFGVRTYVGGTGARGTLIISASLGVGAVSDGSRNESVAGPSVAYGMEWRL